jgi:hypothetical protein
MLSSLLINIYNVKDLKNTEFISHRLILCTDWVVFVIMLVSMILSRVLKRLDFILPTLLLIMLKHYLVTMDCVGVEESFEKNHGLFRLVYQVIWIIKTQFLINSMASNSVAIPLSFCTAICITMRHIHFENVG